MYFLFFFWLSKDSVSFLEPETFYNVEDALQRMKRLDVCVDIKSELDMLNRNKHSTNYFDRISGYKLIVVSDKLNNYYDSRFNELFSKEIKSWKSKNRNSKIEKILN